MKRRPTIEDVAREVGLSTATVSRALHLEYSTKVSEETRQRVREAARALDYRPNLAGRSLATGRANMVAYWAMDAFSTYYSSVARNICSQASNRGYDVLINSTHDGANARLSERARRPMAANCDGVIACDVAVSSQYFADVLQSNSIPLIGVGMYFPPDKDYVGLDLYQASVNAIEHLIKQGCKRIAHVTQTTEKNDPRGQAYEAVLSAAGLPLQGIHIEHHQRKEGRECIVAYIEEQRSLGRELPDALFCINDEVAIGCYRGLCDLGIGVPDDMLLLGCDGIEDSEYQACPISTIALPVQKMCSLAWDFLEERIKHPEKELQQTMLPGELVIRASTQTSVRSQTSLNQS